jgi:hypothetical protein
MLGHIIMIIIIIINFIKASTEWAAICRLLLIVLSKYTELFFVFFVPFDQLKASIEGGNLGGGVGSTVKGAQRPIQAYILKSSLKRIL